MGASNTNSRKYIIYHSPQRVQPVSFGCFVWGARLSPQLRHPTAPPKTPTSTFPEAPDLPRGICRRLGTGASNEFGGIAESVGGGRTRPWSDGKRATEGLRSKEATSIPDSGPKYQNIGRDFSTLKYYNAENSQNAKRSINSQIIFYLAG